MSSKANFQCRFYLIEGIVVELKCWCYELDPMKVSMRPSEEWVEEHIQQCYSEEDLRKMFLLDEGKNYQVLFSGQLSGYYDDHTGEWDEELNGVVFESEEVPEEYSKQFLVL